MIKYKPKIKKDIKEYLINFNLTEKEKNE